MNTSKDTSAPLSNHVVEIFTVIHEATTALEAMIEVCGRVVGAVKERDHWLSESAEFLVHLPAVIGQEYLHCLHLTVIDAGETMGRIVKACSRQRVPLISIWTAWLKKAEAAISTAIRVFQSVI